MCRYPLGRPIGKFLRELQSLGHDLVGGHEVVVQTHAGRIGTFDGVVTHQELFRAVRPNQQGPDDGAAVTRHEPDFHMRIGDSRSFGSNSNIAQQCHGGRQPDAIAVDGAYDRLLAIENFLDDRTTRRVSS